MTDVWKGGGGGDAYSQVKPLQKGPPRGLTGEGSMTNVSVIGVNSQKSLK